MKLCNQGCAVTGMDYARVVTAVEMRTYWWTRIQPGWQSNMGILILQKVDAVSCQETVQFVPSALSGVEMTRDNR